MDEWISVKDRMPESRKAVLGYVKKSRNIFSVYCKDGVWYYWEPGPCSPFKTYEYGEITHWRNMPEPPVIPVLGEWIPDSDGLPTCSICGEVAMQRMSFSVEKHVYDCQITLTKFCPHCGIEMNMEKCHAAPRSKPGHRQGLVFQGPYTL